MCRKGQRVRFWSWCQISARRQLKAAAQGLAPGPTTPQSGLPGPTALLVTFYVVEKVTDAKCVLGGEVHNRNIKRKRFKSPKSHHPTKTGNNMSRDFRSVFLSARTHRWDHRGNTAHTATISVSLVPSYFYFHLMPAATQWFPTLAAHQIYLWKFHKMQMSRFHPWRSTQEIKEIQNNKILQKFCCFVSCRNIQ